VTTLPLRMVGDNVWGFLWTPKLVFLDTVQVNFYRMHIKTSFKYGITAFSAA
jgi:hypothetical protein